jgi:AcrR family transcriptional regulator
VTVAKNERSSRTYRSALREEQARRTRAAVLDAAEACFGDAGYASTTMKDVAARAGVSVETVYAQGSKASLLLAVVDRVVAGDDEPVPLSERPRIQALYAAAPHDVPRILRDLVVAGVPRALEVMAAFERAAGADPEVAAAYATYADRRRADTLRMAEALRPGLRPGLGVEEVADVLWLLVDGGNVHRMVVGRGWGVERFADWLEDTARRLFLEPGSGSPAAG